MPPSVWFNLPPGTWLLDRPCPACGGPPRRVDDIEGLPVSTCMAGCDPDVIAAAKRKQYGGSADGSR